jgi:biopolymer transport protein ExbD
MGMSSGGGDKKAVTSEINVTPLIDVLLVLLIIFLVVMPIMMKKEELTIPRKIDESQEQPNPDSSLFSVKLTAGGKVIFGDGINVDREIQASAVVGELRDKLNAVKAGSEKVVFVDFEHGVKWSDVVSMMDTLRSMATDPNHDEVKVALTICDWDKRQQSGCLKPGAGGQ